MASTGERSLWQAVRVAVVLRYLGELALVLGAITLVPAAATVLLGDYAHLPAYLGVAVALVMAGLAARRLPCPHTLLRHEALVITALAFLLSPLVLSLPLVDAAPHYLDVIFEAVSGITTTGLSTLEGLSGRAPGFLFARAWLQWVGGLGFVVLSLALLPTPPPAARQLGAPALETSDMAASMRAHARLVLVVYLALSSIGMLLLLGLGASAFEAVVLTLSAVSTGGFAPHDDSLAASAPLLAAGVFTLALCGAVSLPLYAALARGRWRALGRDPEARALALAVLLVTALLVLMDDGRHSAGDLLFLASSAQSTAGFATFDSAALPADAKAVLVVSMLIGGAQGSTAGGIKLLRLLLLVRLVQWLIVQTRLPSHAVSTPSLDGHALEPGDLLRVASVVLLFAGVVLLSWLPFLAYGYAPLDALFEVVSATGTVGLSTGITRPALEPLLKGVLCADMILGRLEVFALLVTLSPRTWLGRRAH